MSNYDENNLETWPLEALKALLRAKQEEEIEDIHKQLATKLKTYNKLEEENKKLKEMNVWLLEAGQHYEEENKKLTEENKKLKKMEKDIMEEEHAGILGCTPWERFSNALEELNYDEKWIVELKQENSQLREQLEE